MKEKTKRGQKAKKIEVHEPLSSMLRLLEDNKDIVCFATALQFYGAAKAAHHPEDYAAFLEKLMDLGFRSIGDSRVDVLCCKEKLNEHSSVADFLLALHANVLKAANLPGIIKHFDPEEAN